MINLNNILIEEFSEESINEILILLEEHSFKDSLLKSIELINYHLNNNGYENRTFGFAQIGHVAGFILIDINEKLREIVQVDENLKLTLEVVLGAIGRQLLIQVLSKQTPARRKKITSHITMVLIDACRYKGYSDSELFSFFNIKGTLAEGLMEEHAEQVVLPKKKETAAPYYSWKGDPNKFDDFIRICVNELNICLDETEFRKLFEKPKSSILITLNDKKSKDVIKFFAVTKEFGILSHHGCKGFYQVLQSNVKGFDNVYLKGNTPGDRVDNVKRHIDFEDKRTKYRTILGKLKKR